MRLTRSALCLLPRLNAAGSTEPVKVKSWACQAIVPTIPLLPLYQLCPKVFLPTPPATKLCYVSTVMRRPCLQPQLRLRRSMNIRTHNGGLSIMVGYSRACHPMLFQPTANHPQRESAMTTATTDLCISSDDKMARVLHPPMPSLRSVTILPAAVTDLQLPPTYT